VITRKAVDNLPALRSTLSAINDNYLNVQQDIVETFLDRGQLRKLAQRTITAAGKRIAGLKLDNPRQLALIHALVCFSHIAAGNSFTTAELHPRAIDALGSSADRYTFAWLRYDLSKLRAKGLVEKLSHSRRYRLLPNGYSICLVFLKLFERVYSPLTRRPPLADQGRRRAPQPTPVPTRPPLPARRRRSRQAHSSRRPQGRMTAAPNANEILVSRKNTR
jgi:hypothetical protein